MLDKRPVNRRAFLRGSALALAGLCLAGCGQRAASALPENYYVDNHDRILKDVTSLLGFVEAAAAQRYGDEAAAAIARDSLAGCEDLLVDLPYIGGDKNELTQNLCQSAGALAFYRVMLAQGRTLEDTGEILYRAVQAQMTAMPMVGVSGRLANSSLAQKQLRVDAQLSQERRYPEDWVFAFVEGDGSFDFGIDYTECGICKYYAAQNASELTPYLCLLDFPISQAMDTGLVRTSTLGSGGSLCDFRYRSGRPCQMEWTPDFLKVGG